MMPREGKFLAAGGRITKIQIAPIAAVDQTVCLARGQVYALPGAP